MALVLHNYITATMVASAAGLMTNFSWTSMVLPDSPALGEQETILELILALTADTAIHRKACSRQHNLQQWDQRSITIIVYQISHRRINCRGSLRRPRNIKGPQAWLDRKACLHPHRVREVQS